MNIDDVDISYVRMACLGQLTQNSPSFLPVVGTVKVFSDMKYSNQSMLIHKTREK